MSASFLFIGVVSHERTTYPQAQGPDGLAAQLCAALTARGAESTVEVHTENRLDVESEPVTSVDVQQALSAQVRLEAQWDRYLYGAAGIGFRTRVSHVLRYGKRLWHQLRQPPPSMVTRLLNIEMAHEYLLSQGIASGAEWVLILEDDAWAQDVDDLAEGLRRLLADAEERVQFMNLSESFGISELGIGALLRDSDCIWSGSQARSVLSAERPVTNTVCAIAYRSSFAELLLRKFQETTRKPVVPIDWKLNRALMNMFESGEIGSGSCWWVVPGPIDQLSMGGTS